MDIIDNQNIIKEILTDLFDISFGKNMIEIFKKIDFDNN